ncbi:MAG: DNA translocase FtsK 4TM domain-containing protein [Oceanospirillaceae bacterium]|nr:DNA translocase FtsK 4TM domain-containing protein [Oceanospirillaceae bacterium]
MKEKKDKEISRDSLQGPMEFTDLVARIIKDGVLLVLVGFCLFSLMSSLGYDAKDSGWSHVGYQPKVGNSMGSVGALWADLTFSFIGLLAWVAPLMLLYPCIRLYRRKQVSLLDSLPFVMLRVVGGILFVFSSCALFSLHLSNEFLSYPFTTGGIIGQAFSEWLVSWFSLQGSSVVLWFSAMLGLTLFMELSWRDLVIKLGGGLLYCYEALLSLLSKTAVVTEPALGVNRESSTDAKKHPPIDNSAVVANSVKSFGQTGQVEDTLADIGFSADQRVPQNLPPKIANKRVENVTHNNQVLDNASLDSAADAEIRVHLAQPLPVLSSQQPAVEKTPGTLESLSARSVKQVPPMIASRVDNKPNTAAIAAEVATANNSRVVGEHRSVKIVPLSEAHQSTLEERPPFANQANTVVELPEEQVPSVDLLDVAEEQTEAGYSLQQLEDMSRLLEIKLKDFGVIVEVVEVNPGPVITRFEIQPAAGVKSSKIVNLAKDLARSLAVMSVRVVEVIPGKSVMGIEIPNINRKMVRLSEILTSPVYQEASSKLTLALGNDIAGNPVVANLGKMPHLLVAGTTGSGKSVGVNAMILSLLFKAGPKDVRLMMVDPKMLELSIYEGIPHLLTPVITDMKEAAGGLRWCVAEMERRYKLMAKMGVRNLDGFNDKVRAGIKAGQPLVDPLWDPQEQGQSPGTPAPALEVLPYIVVVIDEFADMMMIVGKKVEELIARIAQKARAAGIHLILATQRPSVDVITGLIKANVPTRIAFQVSSRIDSRTILDQGGAENLLGNGDMLYLPAGTSVPSRVHGAFVSDDEVHRTVEAWKRQGKPDYINMQVADEGTGANAASLFGDDEQDALYDESVAFITTTRKASISSVQRKFKIGYNRAARIVESMEAAGVISSAGTNGQREVLAPPPPRD